MLVSRTVKDLVAGSGIAFDERGSREYNIGLGERRAQSVRRALLLQGAADAQISTVSYGEERPAVAGHDEAAWAKNRRAEIAYR